MAFPNFNGEKRSGFDAIMVRNEENVASDDFLKIQYIPAWFAKALHSVRIQKIRKDADPNEKSAIESNLVHVNSGSRKMSQVSCFSENYEILQDWKLKMYIQYMTKQ